MDHLQMMMEFQYHDPIIQYLLKSAMGFLWIGLPENWKSMKHGQMAKNERFLVSW